jgi:hypothetical protein
VLGTDGTDGIDGVDGVVGVVVEPLPLLDPPLAAGACVPWGSRISVYFVPSAVFWSVTGSFTLRVSVCEPLA